MSDITAFGIIRHIAVAVLIDVEEIITLLGSFHTIVILTVYMRRRNMYPPQCFATNHISIPL